MSEQPGRSCPLRYRHGAAALATAPERVADTLYVIGGLYGNRPALATVEALAAAESGPVTLCFNGDFHWFDVDDAAFVEVNQRVLRRIATHTKLQIDFGGGLKADEDVRIAFENGARQVTGGTVAVKNPELFLGWLEQYGPERIILGSDVRDGKVAVSGWQEQSELELFAFLEDYIQKGIQYSICTDISKDGRLEGTALDLYKEIIIRFPELKLIASGGVTTIEEVQSLREAGCYGAIIGKAIYEGHIRLEELEGLL